MDKNKKPILSQISVPSAKAASAPKKLTTASSEKPKKNNSQASSIQISSEQIAVRAYFISERRRELGWGGNEETDWADAEKQLTAEALEFSKKK